MQLEFHQLDRQWERLRVRQPRRQRQLMASLAESGQQTPIVVVRSSDQPERYLAIDGYKRIAALQQLGRDTVEATVWAMSEAEALPLDRRLRFSPQESALEQGWPLAELEQRLGNWLEALGRRFDRSVNWVSRRLALVELRPEAIQQQVREGAIAAQLAMKYLVPVARVKAEHCARMAAAFVERRCDTRQAGPLYAAWRDGSRVVRERILAEPESFLKTQRQTQAIRPVAVVQERELEMEVAILHRARRRLTEATAGDGLSAAGISAAPKWKARAANSTGRQRESERSGKPNMLSQAQRTAILELSAKGASGREIAHVLRMSRLSVRKALRSNLSKYRKSNGRTRPKLASNRSSIF